MAKNRHRWKIQLGATLATNPFFLNFFQGNISRGKLKGVCVPGLNCYSCPAAAASCPIGAVQAVIGSSKFHFAYYVVGFLLFIGVLLGRVVCGFLCPFGWFQELLHKIPAKKFSTKRFHILKVLIQGYNHNSTIKSSQPTQKRRFLTKGGVFIPREHKALPGRPSMVGKAAR